MVDRLKVGSDIGGSWPKLAQIPPASATFGRNRPAIGRNRPQFDRHWRPLICIGQSRPEFDRHRATFGRHRATFGRHQANFGRTWRNSAEIVPNGGACLVRPTTAPKRGRAQGLDGEVAGDVWGDMLGDRRGRGSCKSRTPAVGRFLFSPLTRRTRPASLCYAQASTTPKFEIYALQNKQQTCETGRQTLDLDENRAR